MDSFLVIVCLEYLGYFTSLVYDIINYCLSKYQQVISIKTQDSMFNKKLLCSLCVLIVSRTIKDNNNIILSLIVVSR